MGSEAMDMFEEAVRLLPERFREEAGRIGTRDTEEIRLRVGQSPGLLSGSGEIVLCGTVSEGDLKKLIEKATNASLYAAADAIRNGTICYNGLRIGIAGEGYENSRGVGFRHYSSLNIRIPHCVKGICDEAFAALYDKGFRNTLIISSPGAGKTTALRDILRLLSYQNYRIGVIDERVEIAPAGVKGFYPGCDIISGLSKEKSAAMLIRGMNPEIIATDEITTAQDIAAIENIYGCGVGLISTAHSQNEEDLNHRPVYRHMLEQGVFSCAIIIERWGSRRLYRWKEL